MKPTYSPAEICRKLDISKTTLLRWEAEGFVPAASRNGRNERCYTREQYEVIAQYAWSRRHRTSFSHAFARDSEESLSELAALTEQHSLTKFVHYGDPTGLAELRERSPLAADTIRELLRYAVEHTSPDDGQFWEILDVVTCTSAPGKHRGNTE